eukprot:SAG22_NODE_18515_length_286_cov_0.807487_1_plen_35_part_01
MAMDGSATIDLGWASAAALVVVLCALGAAFLVVGI